MDKRSLDIVDLKFVFTRLSPLNDRSAVHEVTGRVNRIVMRAFMLGKKREILGRVDERVVGSALKP